MDEGHIMLVAVSMDVGHIMLVDYLRDYCLRDVGRASLRPNDRVAILSELIRLLVIERDKVIAADLHPDG